LIDSDVLIDFLSDREPFTKNAKEIVQKIEEKIINAFLAPHSITNIYYILRKQYSASERKQGLLDLCQSISVVEIGHEMIINALSNTEFNDFEDCLQAECAGKINADYIVTRNIADYTHSKVPAILPENLLKKLET
jgi:predicted nucleic acid-binding protein